MNNYQDRLNHYSTSNNWYKPTADNPIKTVGIKYHDKSGYYNQSGFITKSNVEYKPDNSGLVIVSSIVITITTIISYLILAI